MWPSRTLLLSTGIGLRELGWRRVKIEFNNLSDPIMALLHLGRMQMQMQMKRGFSASSVLFYKDVQHKEEGKKIVVQGVTVASPNKSNVVTEGCREGRQHCHPFCRSPVVGQVCVSHAFPAIHSLCQVKHTDVLLIDQFLTSTGEMYSQDELGICKRQWVRLKKLAEMAQRAGLMPGDPINLAHLDSNVSLPHSLFHWVM